MQHSFKFAYLLLHASSKVLATLLSLNACLAKTNADILLKECNRIVITCTVQGSVCLAFGGMGQKRVVLTEDFLHFPRSQNRGLQQLISSGLADPTHPISGV